MTEPLSQHGRTSAQATTAPLAQDRQRAEPLPHPDASDDAAREVYRESPPTTPRWVKVFAITAIVLLLLLAGLHLTGNAPTHMPSSSSAGQGMQAP